MTIGEWIFAFLRSTPALSDLLGGVSGFRVFPDIAPQGTESPFGTFTIIDFPQYYHLAGPSRLAFPRIQIDWWDDRPGGALRVLQLAELTRNATGGDPQGRKLDGYAGTHAGLHVQKCELVDRRFTSEPPEHGSENPIRRASLDFIVNFVEV